MKLIGRQSEIKNIHNYYLSYIKLLSRNVLPAVRTRLRSHRTLHFLVFLQTEVLDMLSTLCTRDLPILTHWQVGLCVCTTST